MWPSAQTKNVNLGPLGFNHTARQIDGVRFAPHRQKAGLPAPDHGLQRIIVDLECRFPYDLPGDRIQRLRDRIGALGQQGFGRFARSQAA